VSTYVLVHGAWHGGWCWKRVRKALQKLGHEVFTPTLTGLADRVHLLSPQVDLETHITDVVNLIRWEELSDVVLCGHSYGGAVISGVADRIPDRIGALVYLDAFVLANGQSVHDVLPVPMRDDQIDQSQRQGEGWKVAPISAEAFHVNAADLAWVNTQCTMQPLATFQQTLQLTGEIARIQNVTFILAAGWSPSPFSVFSEQAKARGWKTVGIPCGHDVMLDMPEELTRELVAASPGK
jgi:pimeloyl-ACP methyl ester carboxylesterase